MTIHIANREGDYTPGELLALAKSYRNIAYAEKAKVYEDGGPPIWATLQPQVWQGDNAVEAGSAYDFDIGPQVRRMYRAEALAIEDHDYGSDALWQEWVGSHDRPHDGPFEVACEAAIAAYDQWGGLFLEEPTDG